MGETPIAESFVNKESFELIVKGLELWKNILARKTPTAESFVIKESFELIVSGLKLWKLFLARKTPTAESVLIKGVLKQSSRIMRRVKIVEIILGQKQIPQQNPLETKDLEQ